MAAARSFAFSRELRLRRRSEFLRVQDRGHKLSADCLLVLALPNGRADELTRAGFTVSTKVGNAVVRNRVRRVLRELFRHLRDELPRGLDMVFIARQSAADADQPRLRSAFERVVRDLKKLPKLEVRKPAPRKNEPRTSVTSPPGAAKS